MPLALRTKIAMANRELPQSGRGCEKLSAVTIVARVHFRGITAACVSITGEIIIVERGDEGRPAERKN
jgi:hypothetical protein